MGEIQDIVLVKNVIKVLFLSAFSFVFAFLWTPLLTHFLYKYKLGKSIRSSGAPVYTEMHKGKEGTPTMGGILIWLTTLFMAFFIFILYKFSDIWFFEYLNFLTRGETWLPLTALVATALVGLADDIMNVFKIGPSGGGLRMVPKIILYTLLALLGAFWFYYKLGWDVIHIPAAGDFSISFWYIPLFVLVIVAASFFRE